MNAPLNDYEFQPIQPRPWPEFTAELLALYRPPMRAKKTEISMRRSLGVAERCGVKTTSDLTPSVIAAVIASFPDGRSPRTIAQCLRCLRVACNYAVTMRLLHVSPFAARPLRHWVRVGPPRVKPHQSREEIARILAFLEQDIEGKLGWARWRARRLYALVALVAYTGLRKNEALHLQLDDVRLAQRVLFIRDHEGHRVKTEGSAQPIAMPTALVPILADWIAHRRERPAGFEFPDGEVAWLFPNQNLCSPWTEGTAGTKPLDRLHWAAKQVGIANVNFHSLRRSLATHLEAHGVGQAMITRCLRHTSEKISREWYQGTDIPNMVRAVEDLRF